MGECDRITEKYLNYLVAGASLFGCGGGGDPYLGLLSARHAIRKYNNCEIISLQDLDDRARVCCVSLMGSPDVGVEKLFDLDDIVFVFQKMQQHLRCKFDAILPLEIGGINSMIPVSIASYQSIPVVDADCMGRAFPKLIQTTLSAQGVNPCPIVIGNEKREYYIIENVDIQAAEIQARSLTRKMGLTSYVISYPVLGEVIKEIAVADTLTVALEIGQVIVEASEYSHPIHALINKINSSSYEGKAYELGRGSIIDLIRSNRSGYCQGRCVIKTAIDDGNIAVHFQNENIMATAGDRLLAIVPDLIMIVDRATARPIPTERLQYGQSVVVIGVTAPAVLTHAGALRMMGPEGFGISSHYYPIPYLFDMVHTIDCKMRDHYV